jgi:hypothetical protein
MANTPKTNPSRETREEEQRDALVQAGADEIPAGADEMPAGADDMNESTAPPDGESGALDPEVAAHYEEMTERGARQRGEGRLP